MLLNIFPPVSVLSMVPHLLAGNRLLKYLIALLLPGKSGRLLFCMLKKRDASFHTTKTPSVSQSISWEHVWAPQLIHSNCYYWHFAFLHLLSNCNQLLCNHLFQSEMDVDIIIITIYYYLFIYLSIYLCVLPFKTPAKCMPVPQRHFDYSFFKGRKKILGFRK